MSEEELVQKIRELKNELKILDNYQRYEEEVDEDKIKNLKNAIENNEWALNFYRKHRP